MSEDEFELPEVWRTIQFFLGPDIDAVHEVEMEEHSSALRCNCQAYFDFGVCHHTSLVDKRMKKAGGIYAVYMEESALDGVDHASLSDPKVFRNLLLRHAIPESL